jgi:hypothetical protein
MMLIAGGAGGVVLLVVLVVFAVSSMMSAFSDFTEDTSTSGIPVRFSVVQKGNDAAQMSEWLCNYQQHHHGNAAAV